MLKMWLSAFELFIFFTHLHDEVNVFELSKYVFSGNSLFATNLLKILINTSVVWFDTNCRWIALLRLYVNSNMFDSFFLSIIPFCKLLVLQNQGLWLEMLCFWMFCLLLIALVVVFHMALCDNVCSYNSLWWFFSLIVLISESNIDLSLTSLSKWLLREAFFCGNFVLFSVLCCQLS